MFIYLKNSEFISSRVAIRGLFSDGCADNTDQSNRKPTTYNLERCLAKDCQQWKQELRPERDLSDASATNVPRRHCVSSLLFSVSVFG
jgi:hypothetical protein